MTTLQQSLDQLPEADRELLAETIPLPELWKIQTVPADQRMQFLTELVAEIRAIDPAKGAGLH